MAKGKLVPALVESLVQGVRDASPAEDPALRWLLDGGSIDGLSLDAALHAIEAALVLGQGELLAEVKAEARNKELRKAAGAAIHRLRAAGQKVEEVRASHQFTLAPEAAPEMPPVAFLSAPDHDGTFSFLTLVTGESETVVFAGIAGGVSGFKDVEHTHLGRARRRAVIEDVRRDENLSELPFHVALQLLERAFEIGGKVPHEWDHLLVHLDEGIKTSARVLPAFPDALETPHPDQLAQVLPLIMGPHAMLLVPDQQTLMQATVEVLGATGGAEQLGEEDREARKSDAIDRAADEVVDGFRRATWGLALDQLAVIAQHRGWEEMVEPARHSALALKLGWKGRDIPYVREVVTLVVDMQLNQFSGIGASEEARTPDEASEADEAAAQEELLP